MCNIRYTVGRRENGDAVHDGMLAIQGENLPVKEWGLRRAYIGGERVGYLGNAGRVELMKRSAGFGRGLQRGENGDAIDDDMLAIQSENSLVKQGGLR